MSMQLKTKHKTHKKLYVYLPSTSMKLLLIQLPRQDIRLVCTIQLIYIYILLHFQATYEFFHSSFLG